MTNTERALYERRVAGFMPRLEQLLYPAKTNLTLRFAVSDDPVRFEHREKGAFEAITKGEVWGKTWKSAWFHATGAVPREWAGKVVVALINLTGEACVFDAYGTPIYGLTGYSVFNPRHQKDRFEMFRPCHGGEKVDLWVEASASGLFGMVLNQFPDPNDPERFGTFEARVQEASLAIFREDVFQLLMDWRVLENQMHAMPQESVRRSRMLRGLSKAMDQFRPDAVDKTRRLLDPLLKTPAGSSDLTTRAVGHAHIDTAWLWPLHETIRKCGRTFASQIAMIEKYPRYVFGASQPQLYQYTKDNYPRLYEKIKAAVKAGRWEVQGGMWVEADANLISGESMVRQLLIGKNFFLDEFGIEVKNLWLPDVFGYSAAMPQILRKAGIDVFLTQKISWSQFNTFPHHTFRWVGIDGSEVLVHFPPEDTYNSPLIPEGLIKARDSFREKAFLDEFMTLFGVGDGGGGPSEEHIEAGLREANIEGCPRVVFGAAQEMLDRLESHRDELATWVGELYLELHRGTLTTQARNKRMNRKLEYRLRDVEILYSCLPAVSYPREVLDRTWKLLLLNQFHDIIPGSSIHRVYEESQAQYAAMSDDLDALVAAVGPQLFETDADSLCVVNTTSFDQIQPVRLPDSWSGSGLSDDSGAALPTQREEATGKVYASVKVAAWSAVNLRRTDQDAAAHARMETDGTVLENDLVRYEFDAAGNLTAGYDKECEVAILTRAAELQLYDDQPIKWDAWDVDIFYENQLVAVLAPTTCQAFGGVVRKGLLVEYQLDGCVIKQEITLARGSKRLDFDTVVEWEQRRRMLRAAFFTTLNGGQARYDIQFGTVERTAHRNTSWDMARFEVAGHRFADLSRAGWGVAVLNDCKYGYKVLGGEINLNLLRGPVSPDPDADRGSHRFTYSLLPHRGDLRDSDVFREAVSLNQPALIFEGLRAESFRFPVSVEGEGVVFETLKRAERNDDLVVRVWETRGCPTTGRLAADGLVAIETDLLERSSASRGDETFGLGPYEIRTYRLTAT